MICWRSSCDGQVLGRRSEPGTCARRSSRSLLPTKPWQGGSGTALPHGGQHCLLLSPRAHGRRRITASVHRRGEDPGRGSLPSRTIQRLPTISSQDRVLQKQRRLYPPSLGKVVLYERA